uniref:Uncharacterized protein n=1 Tax=Caenorhabditis tropicalis TaxID=1561998 RepID=A0A1I7UXF5_9PELO
MRAAAKIAEDVESSWPDLVKDVLGQIRKVNRRRQEGSIRSDVKRSLATSPTRRSDQNLFDGRKVERDGWLRRRWISQRRGNGT